MAVLKLSVPRHRASQLQPVTLGSSSALRVGQHVFAIGERAFPSGVMLVCPICYMLVRVDAVLQCARLLLPGQNVFAAGERPGGGSRVTVGAIACAKAR